MFSLSDWEATAFRTMETAQTAGLEYIGDKHLALLPR